MSTEKTDQEEEKERRRRGEKKKNHRVGLSSSLPNVLMSGPTGQPHTHTHTRLDLQCARPDGTISVPANC